VGAPWWICPRNPPPFVKDDRPFLAFPSFFSSPQLSNGISTTDALCSDQDLNYRHFPFLFEIPLCLRIVSLISALQPFSSLPAMNFSLDSGFIPSPRLPLRSPRTVLFYEVLCFPGVRCVSVIFFERVPNSKEQIQVRPPICAGPKIPLYVPPFPPRTFLS